MRVKEANGLAVYLAVDGEKLDEQRVRKIGDEDTGIRMECFVYPTPNQEYTINVHLGRRTPWKKDWIAEPVINGNKIHSLHVRKNWHVTHKLSSFYEEDEDGGLIEAKLSFGDMTGSFNGEEVDEGDDLKDNADGMIVIEISRGEIERVKPTRKRIGQRIRQSESSQTRVGVASGSSKKAEDKSAYGEEFTYDEEDNDKPFLKFVFKVRSRQYLVNNGLLHRVPAQQHPSQVSRTVRLKAEPDAELANIATPVPPKTQAASTHRRRLKRELSDDSVGTASDNLVVDTESAKRLRLERENEELRELVQQLRRKQGG